MVFGNCKVMTKSPKLRLNRPRNASRAVENFGGWGRTTWDKVRLERKACNSVKTRPFCVRLHEAAVDDVDNLSSKLGPDWIIHSCDISNSSAPRRCRVLGKGLTSSRLGWTTSKPMERDCSTNQVPYLPKLRSQDLLDLPRRRKRLAGRWNQAGFQCSCREKAFQVCWTNSKLS